MVNTLALRKIAPPAFLCAYNEEGDALNLVHALARYGIEAEVRVIMRQSYYDENCVRRDHLISCVSSHSIWIKNGADRDRAHAFKQGLLAALSMKGDPGAFADGILLGARMRNPGKKPLIIEKGKRKVLALKH